jgi:hypothetical protein
MAVINVPSNKNIEFLDLEVHAIMCEQRRMILEEKIDSLSARIKDLDAQEATNKRLMIGAIGSIITGVMSTIVSLLARNL